MSTDANNQNNGDGKEPEPSVVAAIIHRVATPAGEYPLTVALVEVHGGMDLMLSIPGEAGQDDRQMSLDLANALYLLFHEEDVQAAERPRSGTVLFTWHCPTCNQRAAQIYDDNVLIAEAMSNLKHQHEENSPECEDSPVSFCVGSPTKPPYYPASIQEGNA